MLKPGSRWFWLFPFLVGLCPRFFIPCMKFPRVFLALLLVCLLFAQQGSVLHALEHALALRGLPAAGAPVMGAQVAHAADEVCALCAAFAVLGSGAVRAGLALLPSGEQVLAAASSFASASLPAQLAFAPRAPPVGRAGTAGSGVFSVVS